MQWLGQIFGAISSVADYLFGWHKDKNAPDVRAAAKAQRELDQQADETKAVAEGNEAEVQKRLAE